MSIIYLSNAVDEYDILALVTTVIQYFEEVVLA